MLDELPTHPRFVELTPSQKDAVQLQGQVIQDQLNQIKSLVNDRFNESRARRHEPDAAPAPAPAPVQTPTPTPQRQRQRTQDANRRSTEDQRRQQQEEESRARRARHQHEAQMLAAEQRRRQQTTTNGHDQVNNIVANARLARQEQERLEEQKRLQEAAMLGYPTPASLRTRPDSYEAPPQSSVPQSQHSVPERSASAAGLHRTNSAARVHPPVPVPVPPTAPAPIPRAPSRTASRADNHYHRPISDPRSRENPPVSAPPRSGSRADHRPVPTAIRTDAFATRNESAPAMYGASAVPAAALNAAYGPGLAYGANPLPGTSARPRKPSLASPVKERPPAGGFNGPPPTTHAPVPRRRTASTGPPKPPVFAPDPRANGVFPTIDKRPPEQRSSYPNQSPTKHPAPVFPHPEPASMSKPELQGILPLESPSHTWAREPEVHAPAPRRNAANGHGPVRGSSYPPPITTTSPPPGPISYPTIMTMHQREQGYYPSSYSMFSLAGLATALTAERDIQAFGSPPKQHLNTPPALLFQPNPDPTPPGSKAQLPGGYGTPTSQTQTNYATRPPPAVPMPTPPAPAHTHEEDDTGRLRQVLLPEEVIQKFMSIAKPNTLRRVETCGLLLGKARNGGFAVTTLLIPRQRGTTDTCEMVEEELILDFQETRGLITLGWIHTHPTQSCFMSSMDLHTHSGYQASLKEAFAIVCAPSSSPNVGIFRLTDPPGLQVILKCTAKESFHPHTSGNIYTDADQGHVKMVKKLELSIVDLRRHSG
ncbi:STAM-binding protein [Rhizoctonia solani AG-1 IB]|uniref:STAM-binding protein n=1 Tax=Thanatephorus cucumeris (strain AG1-IB / isolate 7/3/14) TaxID=1108050 RepID=A0A0B7F8N4_THACB|nr:STAM-binding protein [Rhizoctonia solani AG-1 IB]